MIEREEIVEEIEENAGQIKGYGVEEIELFGSYARDEQEEGSDIDLLVSFRKGRGLFEDYIGLKRFLEDLFDTEVDLVKKEKVREELKDEIVRGENIGAKI